MKEQIIIEILHHLPSFSPEQLSEIKDAVRIVLCKYDIAAKADVSNVHPHRFRRTSATDLLSAGMPLEQVQELLGHRSIETTRIYCTVNQEAVKHNHKRLMNF